MLVPLDWETVKRDLRAMVRETVSEQPQPHRVCDVNLVL
jgi:hypothetical protein